MHLLLPTCSAHFCLGATLASTLSALRRYPFLDMEMTSQRPLKRYACMSYVANPRVSLILASPAHTHTHSTPSAGRARGNRQAFWNQFHALGHDKQLSREQHPSKERTALGIRGMHQLPEKESLTSDALSKCTFHPYIALLGADSPKTQLHLPGHGQDLYFRFSRGSTQPLIIRGAWGDLRQKAPGPPP